VRPETLSAKRFTARAGSLVVAVASAHIITSTMSGRIDLTLARHFMESIDAWVNGRRNNLYGFHDWEGVHDYDSDARLEFTPWTKVRGPDFDQIHMLVRSRALSWGLKVVNSLTGDRVTAHHSRQTFDDARRLVTRAAPA
jgi:hypothetical protein